MRPKKSLQKVEILDDLLRRAVPPVQFVAHEQNVGFETTDSGRLQQRSSAFGHRQVVDQVEERTHLALLEEMLGRGDTRQTIFVRHRFLQRRTQKYIHLYQCSFSMFFYAKSFLNLKTN